MTEKKCECEKCKDNETCVRKTLGKAVEISMKTCCDGDTCTCGNGCC